MISLDPKRAAWLTAKRYKAVELSPSASGFLELFLSDGFETTFLAIEKAALSPECLQLLKGNKSQRRLEEAIEAAILSGDLTSYGGISLWNASATKRFQVVRLIFAKDTWLSLPFRASLYAAIMAVMGLWGWSTVGRATSVWQSADASLWGWIWVGMAIIEACVQILAVWLLVKFIGFVEFVVSRDSSHMTIRGFAPFWHGSSGMECLHNAVLASQTHARERGFGLFILNLDENHPCKAIFPKPGFRTLFLQKWLSDEVPSDEWGLFSSDAFCDPRNM